MKAGVQEAVLARFWIAFSWITSCVLAIFSELLLVPFWTSFINKSYILACRSGHRIPNSSDGGLDTAFAITLTRTRLMVGRAVRYELTSYLWSGTSASVINLPHKATPANTQISPIEGQNTKT